MLAAGPESSLQMLAHGGFGRCAGAIWLLETRSPRALSSLGLPRRLLLWPRRPSFARQGLPAECQFRDRCGYRRGRNFNGLSACLSDRLRHGCLSPLPSQHPKPHFRLSTILSRPRVYAQGFLGAYGVILALIDRQLAATEGRPWAGEVVFASLCQTSMWMALLGARCPSFFSYVARVTRLLWSSDRRATTVGDMTYLPMTAAVDMEITPAHRHSFERWWPDDAPTEDLVPIKK